MKATFPDPAHTLQSRQAQIATRDARSMRSVLEGQRGVYIFADPPTPPKPDWCVFFLHTFMVGCGFLMAYIIGWNACAHSHRILHAAGNFVWQWFACPRCWQ